MVSPIAAEDVTGQGVSQIPRFLQKWAGSRSTPKSAKPAERHHVLNFAKANNDRIGGWQKMRDMIENAAADRPEKSGLWVFSTCVNFLRTVPTLQRDEANPDDVNSDQEDHCGDAARYACNTVPKKVGVGRYYQ